MAHSAGSPQVRQRSAPTSRSLQRRRAGTSRCGTARRRGPVVATLNFAAGDTAPNAASVPLDSTGGLCVYSPVGTDLVVDVNGFYGPGGAGQFPPLTPVRLMDTRLAFGSARLAAGETAELQVGGVGAIPPDVRAAVAAGGERRLLRGGVRHRVPVRPASPGRGEPQPHTRFREAEPRGRPRLGGRPSVPVLADRCRPRGRCHRLPVRRLATPVQLHHTVPVHRHSEAAQVDINAGTGGKKVGAGSTLVVQIAGNRGIPADARAMSVNIAVTGANAPGSSRHCPAVRSRTRRA